MKTYNAAAMFVAAMFVSAVCVAADDAASRITSMRDNIKKHAESLDDSQKTRIFSEEIGVPADQAQQAWTTHNMEGSGEMTVRLAMAKEAQAANPEKYKSLNDALKEIQSQRAAGKDYHTIASHLNVNMANVELAVGKVDNAFYTAFQSAPSGPAAAPDASAENSTQQAGELRQIQQQIDDKSPLVEDHKEGRALAAQFGVPESVITGLRQKYQTKGWGEITIQLAMAKALHDANPGTYASVESALTKIQELRGNQSRGWDQIATDVKVSLRPVVDSVRHARESAYKV